MWLRSGYWDKTTAKAVQNINIFPISKNNPFPLKLNILIVRTRTAVSPYDINLLRSIQRGRHFADDILKWIFLDEVMAQVTGT